MNAIRKSILSLALLALLASCTFASPAETPTPTPDAALTAQVEEMRQTQQAMLATSDALIGTLTEMARATATPTLTPTATPTPGPIVIDDDFSRDVGRWAGCTHCEIRDGVFYLGPYPSVDSAEGYPVFCQDCGAVEHFVMAVDAWYVEGATDRGFGFVFLDEDNGEFSDFEITTWQVYGVWHYNPNLYGPTSFDAWLSSQGWQDAIHLVPGRQVNHIELRVEPYDNPYHPDMCYNKLQVFVNLRHEVDYYPLCQAGRVGLIVGLHSIGAGFDNFHFEEGAPADAPDE